jgi:hypothetical protein
LALAETIVLELFDLGLSLLFSAKGITEGNTPKWAHEFSRQSHPNMLIPNPNPIIAGPIHKKDASLN